VEGCVIDGLSTTQLEVTFDEGALVQRNFQNYRLLKLDRSPEVECHFIQSENSPTGLGEPPIPPVAPAIANAIFAATGTRLRAMPFKRAGITV
jgi:isoquinoline 1-oxidoreductase beta subunit